MEDAERIAIETTLSLFEVFEIIIKPYNFSKITSVICLNAFLS